MPPAAPIPSPPHPLRRVLDLVYDGAAVLAALCLVALLGMILAQMGARWMRVMFAGGAEYAGYLMAAASFLAFAHTLNRGGHIRVGLLLNALGPRRNWAEALCLVIGGAISLYLAWFSIRLVRFSYRLNDISQGQDATPLWIVQMPLAVGAVLLAVAFIDNLVTLALTGQSRIPAGSAEAQSHGE